MIAKDFRGNGFRGLLNYVLAKEHDPLIITKEALFSETPRELAHEFGMVRRERLDVEKPVHHVSLSFAHEDRRLEPHELEAIARRFMAEMGYAKAQYIVVEHRDRDHQHLHIVASRIRPDKTLVRFQYRDWERGMQVLRGVERDYGLRTVGRDPERGIRQPRREEYRLAVEHGKLSERITLQKLIFEAWQGQPDFATFVQRLRESEVRVLLYRDRAGEVSGISYGWERLAFGGFSLGPSYTWKGLQRVGVRYDPAAHKELVTELIIGERLTWRDRVELRRPGADLEKVRLLVRGGASGNPTLSEFVHRLDYLGVRVKLNVATTGYVSGITYELEGKSYKGSSLGREFSWKGVQGLGVSYEEGRDGETVRLLGRILPAPSDTPASGKEIDQVERMRALICGAVTDRPSFTEYVRRLEGAGVCVRAYQDQSGLVFSLGYRLEGTYIRSRELGDSYSWAALQRKHVRYNIEADEGVVRRIGNVLGGRREAGSGGVELASILREAEQGHPTLLEFKRRLTEKGVELSLYRVDNIVTGVGYTHQDRTVRGRELGNEFTWQHLTGKDGVLTPDPGTDGAVIQGLARDVPGRGDEQVRLSNIEEFRGAVTRALEHEPTLTEFVTRLEAAGVKVELFTDIAGDRFRSISYSAGDVWFKDTELGPGHSWSRLVRSGLDVDVKRDREVLARVARTLPRSWAREANVPAPQALERVRLVVEGAVIGRPTYTEFVKRVESAGVEVRLLGDGSGPRAISYGLGDAEVKGTRLGPGHSWRRLERQGVALDLDRDAEAIRKTFRHLEPPDVARVGKGPSPEVLAHVRHVLDAAAQGRPTFTEFARRAEGLGVEVRLYRDRDERIFGASYGLGDVSIKARDLGGRYRWRDLQDRLVFHPARDSKAADARATTLERPRSVTTDLGRAFRAARGAAAWIRSPERQILRLGARVLFRGALELAKGAAYTASLRRAERNEREWQTTLAKWRLDYGLDRSVKPVVSPKVSPPVAQAPVPTPDVTPVVGGPWRHLRPGPETIEADRLLLALVKSSDDFARRYGFPLRVDPVSGMARAIDTTQKIVRTFIDRGM